MKAIKLLAVAMLTVFSLNMAQAQPKHHHKKHAHAHHKAGKHQHHRAHKHHHRRKK